MNSVPFKLAELFDSVFPDLLISQINFFLLLSDPLANPCKHFLMKSESSPHHLFVVLPHVSMDSNNNIFPIDFIDDGCSDHANFSGHVIIDEIIF